MSDCYFGLDIDNEVKY